MVVLITVIHVIICAFLIIVVLLQSGQSGDIAAAFGGMGSQTAFGTRTAATVLGRATTWAAIASCSPPSRYRYLRRAGPTVLGQCWKARVARRLSRCPRNRNHLLPFRNRLGQTDRTLRQSSGLRRGGGFCLWSWTRNQLTR